MSEETRRYFLANAKKFHCRFPDANVCLRLRVDEEDRLVVTEAIYKEIYENGEPEGLEEFRKLLRGFFSA